MAVKTGYGAVVLTQLLSTMIIYIDEHTDRTLQRRYTDKIPQLKSYFAANIDDVTGLVCDLF